MKTANKIFVLLFVFSIGCSNKKHEKKYYIDVLDDTKLETLIIDEKDDVSEISLIYKGNKRTILKVLPLYSSDFKTTFPPIETVSIEANSVQSCMYSN